MSGAQVPNDELTRRRLIGSGAAAVTALVVGPFGPTRVAHAAGPVGTFALDPTQGGTCTTGSCVTCQACQLHAANKLFQTAEAADLGRAHPGCLCSVIAGPSFSSAVAANLFSAGAMADRRYTQTAQYLNAEVEQRSVPMVTGLVPVTMLAGGAAMIVWITARRRSQTEPGAPV
jgi:hypothetical protein